MVRLVSTLACMQQKSGSFISFVTNKNKPHRTSARRLISPNLQTGLLPGA